MRLVPLALFTFVFAALLVTPSHQVGAAAFTVNNTLDSGVGSLRQAIMDANGTGGADVITFAPGVNGTINLGSSLPSITDILTINGPGTGTITVNGCPTCWIFDNPSTTANINNLTLQAAGQGAVRSAGSTTLDNLLIRNNPNAGVIGFGGPLTVTNSTITGDTNTTSNGGGILFSGTTLTVTNSLISNNNASPSSGGGISMQSGTAVITNSVISGNQASGGGGIYQQPAATVTLTNTLVTGNSASVTGGGIRSSGTLTLLSSTVSNNTDTGAGGGLFLLNNAAFVTNSTISGNTVNSSTLGGGGIYTSGTVTITNSTIADNKANGSGGGQLGFGAAVPHGTLFNTIIAQGGGGTAGNCLNVTAGNLTSQGTNLSSDGTCPLAGTGDRVNTNPLLQAIANNGGPALPGGNFLGTHLLGTGSPAIDGGNNTGCPATDERGLPRPSDGDANGSAICDIGALEVQGAGVILPSASTPTPNPVATSTPTPVVIAPAVIPQVFQNPGAMAVVMGGIGNGTRNNTPVPPRPAVVDPAAVAGVAPMLRPPSTGDAGLASHPTFSIEDGEGAQP